jgi:hypothetical protein
VPAEPLGLAAFEGAPEAATALAKDSLSQRPADLAALYRIESADF